MRFKAKIQITFLLFLIVGCLIFVTGIALFNQVIFFLGILIMAGSSIGFYLMDNFYKSTNYPLTLNTKKDKK